MPLEQYSSSEEDETMSPGAFYSPDRDGTIMEYLSKNESEKTPRAFKTYEHFQSLLEKGVIEEGVKIRLYYSDSSDRCYEILEGKEECEGMNINVHAGRHGKHKIIDILNEGGFRHWEISGINPQFLRR